MPQKPPKLDLGPTSEDLIPLQGSHVSQEQAVPFAPSHTPMPPEPHPGMHIGPEPQNAVWNESGLFGPKNLQDVAGRIGQLGSDIMGGTNFGDFDAGPSQAVTRMMRPGTRIPDIATRQAGTEKFVNDAKLLDRGVGTAAEWFASRWPRVAAHIGIVPRIAPAGSSFYAATIPEATLKGGKVRRLTKGALPKSIPMAFSQEGVNLPPERLKGVMGHEGTHPAQMLGLGKDAADLYDVFTDALGYKLNPLELSAFRREMESYFNLSRGDYRKLVKPANTIEDKLFTQGIKGGTRRMITPPGAPNAVEMGRRLTGNKIVEATEKVAQNPHLHPTQLFSPQEQDEIRASIIAQDIIGKRKR